MNVLYEEEGAFKVGSVMADNVTSLQVEAPHGKRSKIKAAAVLLRFGDTGLADFLERAQRVADGLDPGFLWEVSSGADEFGFEDLARDYFGHAPAPAEAAGSPGRTCSPTSRRCGPGRPRSNLRRPWPPPRRPSPAGGPARRSSSRRAWTSSSCR